MQAGLRNGVTNTLGDKRKGEKKNKTKNSFKTRRFVHTDTNLNIPSTLFFKNSGGYAKHTIKRGRYSLKYFFKARKTSSKIYLSVLSFFFSFFFCSTKSSTGIKIKLRCSMLVSKANENYIRGTDCAG